MRLIAGGLFSLLALVACMPSTPPATPTLPPSPETPVIAMTSTPLPTATAPPPTSPPPTPTSSPTPGAVEGRISAPDGAQVRQAPGESGEIARIINRGAPLVVTGRTTDNRWLQVVLSDGFSGWVRSEDVELDLGAGALPVSTTVEGAAGVEAAVAQDVRGLRLREQPGLVGDLVVYLDAGTTLDLIGRTGDNLWLQVITPNFQTGWVLAQYVDVHIDLNALPITGVSPTTAFPDHNAEVIETGDGLRLRSAPSLRAAVLANLAPLTPLKIVGRTADSAWLDVLMADGSRGWVAAAYLHIYVNLNSMPITGEAVIITELPPDTSAPTQLISGITATTRQIFRRGQQLGNHANVFTKVGDSITYASWFLGPVGTGQYNLRDYGHLQPVIDYFAQGSTYDGNPFVHGSMAASNGSTTDGVLNPEYADSTRCQPGESPLACEYRVVRPSVALIMLGTNDIIHVPLPDVYRQRLNQIVELSIEMGVIPVLSTIPNRVGYEAEAAQINQIIVQTAHRHDIPLWDYGGALAGLPNGGLADDGVHPSMPPYDASPADFTPENLQYGFIIRNLTALQVLDSIWRQVITVG